MLQIFKPLIFFLAKRGGSPVKCFQSDYVSTNAQVSNSANNAYSFEAKSEGSTENIPLQPKPRKFFKSRATEDSSKAVVSGSNASRGVKGTAVLSNSFPDYHLNNAEFSSSSSVYAGSGNVGYISPTYSSSTSKSPAKRGRGRPKGSRTTSPRGSSKASTGRGTSRGRRRAGRSVRGQQGAGRGKRKRQEWEQSESEEDLVSSDPEEFEPRVAYSYPTEQVVDEAVEEEEEEEVEEEEGN